MLQADAQHYQVEDEILIDPETGEIMEDQDDTSKMTVDDLPKTLRILRAIQRRIDIIDQYESDEIERIRLACSKKRTSLHSTKEHFFSKAETLLRMSGKDRLEYPGLGVIRFGSTRESISTIKWDVLTREEQKRIAETEPKLIKTKIIYQPDKKAILETIKGGRNIEWFTVNPKVETFIFKAE